MKPQPDLRIDIISIFPDMFSGVLNESIIRRAQEKEKVVIKVHDLREYTSDKHRKVDDRPFGGGSGMVMCCQPFFDAVAAVKKQFRCTEKYRRVIIMSPQGEQFTQKQAKSLAQLKHIIILCGHYEGIDERVREHVADMSISIGDYVLTGGELPAMVLVDCLSRLIPGVLGDKNSLKFESFEGNLLEYPHYTRPADFRGYKVPAVLLSGDHTSIDLWRLTQSKARTKRLRPDLYRKPKTKQRIT